MTQGDDCSQEIDIQQCIVKAESGTPLLFGKSILTADPALVLVTVHNLLCCSSLILPDEHMSRSIATSNFAYAAVVQREQNLYMFFV